MSKTLAESIVDHRVDFEKLYERYGSILNLVNVLIGVVPNFDAYLEIWKPGFRTYDVIVSNFLNLPQMLVGWGASKPLVGLGMYTSSVASECMYCSAHCCSFALRRGASSAAITGVDRSPAEMATAAVASGLSTIPHSWNSSLRSRLEAEVGEDDADWIAMGTAMMGFLNKFMDAMGIELEPEAVADVSTLISAQGWSVGQHGWSNPDLANIKTAKKTHS